MSRVKILIVEDELPLLDALTEMFKNEKFHVLRAQDGFEGLNTALKHHPDLILTDILMPKMDGVEFIKRLKKDEWGKQIPIIVLTNLSDKQELTEIMGIGISDYLLKADWSLKDIVHKVNDKLAEKQ